MKKLVVLLAILGCGTCQELLAAQGQTTAPVSYVIHISVDALRPDAITALGSANAPNFYRLRTEGAFTDNARTDYDYTVTLPDHTCQLTGRAVLGQAGHNWTGNSDPQPGETLASNKGAYVAGVFDVAHDHGLRTGLYASKTKFSLYSTSWDGTNGAPDAIGPDNGRNKIDMYVNSLDTAQLVNSLVSNMSALPAQYVFLHLADPDLAGHAQSWDITPGSAYSDAVKAIDSRLGAVFNLIDHDPRLSDHTAIILTADHGGDGSGHGDPTLPADYTVPFYVWGPGVGAALDLYRLNPATRQDPGTNRPPYSAPIQPIRNGEAANVALKFLGQEPVPGSTIDAHQDLAVVYQPPGDLRLTLAENQVILTFTAISNLAYDLQRRDSLSLGTWSNVASHLIGAGSVITNQDNAVAGRTQRFYRVQMHLPGS